MTPLTLAEALRLPPFRRASPLVVAGADDLDRPIRWAHATERLDVHELLRAGDLVLTTGTGLPAEDDTEALADFARRLAEVDSSGLVVELGRRWSTELPASLVTACESAGVPLVALRHEARFAALTQAIGEHVVDAQLAELREAQRVHETFTELSFAQAGPVEILEAVQRLAEGPVVLENAQHRPLDYLAGAEDMTGFLDGWQARSRRVRPAGRTAWDETNGWLLTRLGTGDRNWGRLVIGAPVAPSERLIAVAERAAAALALHRLHDRDRDNLMRRTHREILTGLQAAPDSAEVQRRADLAGYPLHRRQFVGVVIRPRRLTRDADRLVDVAASAVRAAHAAKTPALVCEVDHDIHVLLSLPPTSEADPTVDRFAARVRSQHEVVVAAGRSVPDRAGVGRTLTEAGQVADAVPADAADGPSVHRLEDLHLRGLLSLFGQDDRLRLFVERELAPLRDQPNGRDLVAAVRALVRHPESKTAAAASVHLSRAAFYDRLAKVEQVLGASLADPDVRVSLHVALLADGLLTDRLSDGSAN